MPPRRRLKSKEVSLWEAINWIAFDNFDESAPPAKQDPQIERAKWELFDELRKANLSATGIFNDLRLRERQVIDAALWSFESVRWSESRLSGFAGYSDITVDRERVREIWPNRPSGASGKGRPPKYDEAAFLRLCIWEVSRTQLPPTNAAFVERMDTLVSAAWKDPPQRTWLKGTIRKIFLAKAEFDVARSALTGKK